MYVAMLEGKRFHVLALMPRSIHLRIFGAFLHEAFSSFRIAREELLIVSGFSLCHKPSPCYVLTESTISGP